MNLQVDRSHYTFDAYARHPERFISYHTQLKEVLALTPDSVLEVGVGDKVFGGFIRTNTPISYTSLDVAADLQPDVVGSVLELPFADNTFDVACAFEVLEHLPFSEFERGISELSRVARSHVVISLPHFGPMFALSFKVPFLPLVEFAYKLPFPKAHAWNGQHHWEIGKRGYPARRIRRVLRRYGTLTKDFIPFGSPYHHFFVLHV